VKGEGEAGGAPEASGGDTVTGRPRLSLNQATVQNLSLDLAVDLCLRHEIPAIGLWRHRVAELGLARSAALVRSAGALDLALLFPAPAVGVVIDTYHVWWDSQLAEQVARARGRIAGFQLADWVRPLPVDWRLGRGHLGDGDIDLPWITAQVLDAGYGGYAEVEIFRQEVWDATPDDTAATVRQRFENLRYSLPSSSSR
jgi:hypothetical protein